MAKSAIQDHSSPLSFCNPAISYSRVHEAKWVLQMSLGWDSLPLLPLRCVLDHMSLQDALAAMSVCRHWRSAMLLYEGHVETLKLQVKSIEKTLFLTRLFKKNTRRLHVYMNCSEDDVDAFMTYVLPQYLDTINLSEVLFIGASYIKQNQNLPVVKLKRIIIESLVFKHLHCIKKLALMGCELDSVTNEDDRYVNKQIEYYSRPLSFVGTSPAADLVLSSCNLGGDSAMAYCSLEHIIVDVVQMSSEALKVLSSLNCFRTLTLNVTNRRRQPLTPIDWYSVQDCYPRPLQVGVNLIALPFKKIKEVIENVLVAGFTLTSLKVLFCKTLYTPLLSHVVRLYKFSLKEVVWVDAPVDNMLSYHHFRRPVRQPEYDMCNVNPFILLCWQCIQLRRLVIHGYWIWQYDVLGIVRLRKTLEHLEISSIYSRERRSDGAYIPAAENMVRVHCADSPVSVDQDFLEEVNELTEHEWAPTPWSDLHPGLLKKSTPEQRIDFIAQEARGVT